MCTQMTNHKWVQNMKDDEQYAEYWYTIGTDHVADQGDGLLFT